MSDDREIRQRLRRQIAKAQDYLDRRPASATLRDFIAELEAELREFEE